MTIGINKRETLLYKLTDRLPNQVLTVQHSCGKGGRSYRRSPNLAAPSLAAAGEGWGGGR